MAPSYDSAVTVFSPDGHLFQVEYAQEAVKMGSPAVGVCGKNIIVLVVEKKATEKLQLARTIRKTYHIDNHIVAAFAGLTADARVIVDFARFECQQYSITYEDRVTVEYITRKVADLKQEYTQSSGKRPFGVSMLFAGFDLDESPHLYQTDPSGAYVEWKANAIGKNSKSLLEFLEKRYDDELLVHENDEKVIHLALETILQQSSGSSLEVAILKPGQKMQLMKKEVLDDYLKIIKAEAEDQEKSKRRKPQGV